MKMLYPDHIRTVGIIAPAGKLAPELLESGIAALRKCGLKVKGPASAADYPVPYLAGSPEERAAALEEMWLDPEVDMLLCTRGGFGCSQLLPLLPWKKFARKPMILAGYSDITALHWAMDMRNAGTPVVAPMLGKLSGLDEYSRNAMFRTFARQERSCPVKTVASGSFSGNILAGNLTVAASLAGSDYFPDAKNKVIVLEDVNEPVYKIDRCLTQLEQAGLFERAAGVVFGSFSGSDPGELQELFQRFAARTGLPAVAGFPYGHNFPLLSFSFEDTLTVQQGNAVLK